jgi:hypothetical protein
MNTRLKLGKCNALSGNTGGDTATGQLAAQRHTAASTILPLSHGGGRIAFVLIHWPTGVSVLENV